MVIEAAFVKSELALLARLTCTDRDRLIADDAGKSRFVGGGALSLL